MKRLKLPWLAPTDQSSPLTNQAGSTIRFHLFVHVGSKVFVAESIIRFFGSQVTSKGLSMVFVQDFHPRGFSLEYVQYGLFEGSSPRCVQSRRLIFKSLFDSLVANRWVTFFARRSARKHSGKASIKNLDTS